MKLFRVQEIGKLYTTRTNSGSVIQEESNMTKAQQPIQKSQSPIKGMILTLQQNMLEFMWYRHKPHFLSYNRV